MNGRHTWLRLESSQETKCLARWMRLDRPKKANDKVKLAVFTGYDTILIKLSLGRSRGRDRARLDEALETQDAFRASGSRWNHSERNGMFALSPSRARKGETPNEC